MHWVFGMLGMAAFTVAVIVLAHKDSWTKDAENEKDSVYFLHI